MFNRTETWTFEEEIGERKGRAREFGIRCWVLSRKLARLRKLHGGKGG